VSYDYMPLVSGAQAAGHNIIGPARPYSPCTAGVLVPPELWDWAPVWAVYYSLWGGGLLPVGLRTVDFFCSEPDTTCVKVLVSPPSHFFSSEPDTTCVKVLVSPPSHFFSSEPDTTCVGGSCKATLPTSR
jgi:hypothetical protein